MIMLHQFKSGYNIPNLSPFCVKVETFLRMAGLEYQVCMVDNPGTAPKGKLPYIEDDGKTICDSTFILKHLCAAHGVNLDADLNTTQVATGYAFARMLEERFYFILLYGRWVDQQGWQEIRPFWFGDLPPVVRTLVPNMVQKGIIKGLNFQGVGKHSPDEIYRLADDDIRQIANFLGDKPYFLGDKPSTIDATVFGFVINMLLPIDTPILESAKGHPNLGRYADRMMARYFPS